MCGRAYEVKVHTSWLDSSKFLCGNQGDWHSATPDNAINLCFGQTASLLDPVGLIVPTRLLFNKLQCHLAVAHHRKLSTKCKVLLLVILSAACTMFCSECTTAVVHMSGTLHLCSLAHMHTMDCLVWQG